MAVRRIGRVGRIARVSKGGTVLGGRDILSITSNGGFAQITTPIPHGLSGGSVAISGTSVEGYNTTHNDVLADTPTKFTTSEFYSEDALGGRWDYA